MATLPIFIRHVATVPPDVKAGFADDLYTVQVAENSPPNTLVKTFTVLNNRVFTNDIPLRCTIVSGNAESKSMLLIRSLLFEMFLEVDFFNVVIFVDIFYSNVTVDKNCELRIKEAKLDHEHEPEFKLKIRLDTLTGLVNPDKSVTNVCS